MDESGRPIRILHVDDEPGFVEMVAEFLNREDDRFEVQAAARTDEALDRLAETAVDCVVSDYDLAGRNGIEFLEAVREDDPDLPFILYTGKGSEAVASEAISAGVTDYLQKQGGADHYEVLRNRILNAVESHRSQRALVERNRELRKYERMVNSLHEAACIYDAEGRFEIVNEYLADWYETTPAALEGTESAIIPRIRDRGDGDQYAELLDGEREEIAGELDLEFPQHGHAVLEYSLTPLVVDGAVEGAVGVARDVTDRRARDRQLEQYEAIVETMDDGVYVVDPEGRFVLVNDAYADLLGYDPAAMVGEHVSLVADDELIDRARSVEANLRAGTSVAETIEAHLETADGDRVHLEGKFTLLPDPDGREYRVGVVRAVPESDGE